MTQTRLNTDSLAARINTITMYQVLYALNYWLARGQKNFILRHLFRNRKKKNCKMFLFSQCYAHNLDFVRSVLFLAILMF